MSEFYFGLGQGHMPKRADAIAKKRGAYLVNYTEPNGEKRHWFACKNQGAPFDGAVARDVAAAIVSSRSCAMCGATGAEWWGDTLRVCLCPRCGRKAGAEVSR